MRPVNLIPADLRRGEHSPMRTGPLVYIVLGALALVLVGVTALVLTSNEIADQKVEVETLRREDAAAEAQARRLAAYTEFRSMTEQRLATVTSLADSRFDWERVLRELALILPGDVWLVNLSATATPSTGVGGESGGASGGSASGLRGSVPGPALELSGCASGQDAVAGFVTALKEIDGVTRVGVVSSELGSKNAEAGSSSGGSEDCRTRDFIARFGLVVAFDAAPIPVTGGGEVAPEGEAPAEGAEASAEETEETSEGSEAAEGTEGG